MTEEFSDMSVEEENYVEDDNNASLKANPPDYLNTIGRNEILQLKNNCIQKGLVPLEK